MSKREVADDSEQARKRNKEEEKRRSLPTIEVNGVEFVDVDVAPVAAASASVPMFASVSARPAHMKEQVSGRFGVFNPQKVHDRRVGDFIKMRGDIRRKEADQNRLAKTFIEEAFGISDNQETDPYEVMESLIHQIYKKGNEILTAEFEKFIIAHANNPQIVDRVVFEDSEETLLHHAALDGKLEMVKLLVENGASVVGKTDNGLIAFDLAVCGGHYPVVTYLFSHRNYRDLDTLKKSAKNFAMQIPMLEDEECPDVDKLHSFYMNEFSKLYYTSFRRLSAGDLEALPAIPQRPEQEEDELSEGFRTTVIRDELDMGLPGAADIRGASINTIPGAVNTKPAGRKL